MEFQITISCPDAIEAARIFSSALQDLRFRATVAGAQEPATSAGFPPEVAEPKPKRGGKGATAVTEPAPEQPAVPVEPAMPAAAPAGIPMTPQQMANAAQAAGYVLATPSQNAVQFPQFTGIPGAVPPPAQPPYAQQAAYAVPAPQAAPIPTAEPKRYSVQEISVAAMSLDDAGKRADLQALLAKYGVQALTALPQEYYASFAADLRAMGAKI